MRTSEAESKAMADLTKLGLVGDVHQEHQRLASLLAYFDHQGADRVLCVGDIADGTGDIGRCIRLLKDAAVQCVAGNHDRWLLRGTMRDLPDALPASQLDAEDRSFLAALPRTRTYPTGRGQLLLCHGMGDDDMGQLRPEDEGYALEVNFEAQELIARRHGFVVAGHTHMPMVRRIGETWFVNPGTLRGDHGATSAWLDLGLGEVWLLSVTHGGVDVVERSSVD